jgi:hypothetical protein
MHKSFESLSGAINDTSGVSHMYKMRLIDKGGWLTISRCPKLLPSYPNIHPWILNTIRNLRFNNSFKMSAAVDDGEKPHVVQVLFALHNGFDTVRYSCQSFRS